MDAQAGSTDKDPLGGSTDKERRGLDFPINFIKCSVSPPNLKKRNYVYNSETSQSRSPVRIDYLGCYAFDPSNNTESSVITYITTD